MKVIPTVKEGEKANSKPSYIQKKNKTQGLKKATEAFKSDAFSSSFSHKGYNFTRQDAEERIPETTAIINDIKKNPDNYEIDLYEDGKYKEVRTLDIKFESKKKRMLDGDMKREHSTYNKTIYKFNSDGTIKNKTTNGLYSSKQKRGDKTSVRADEIVDYNYETGTISKRDNRAKNKAKARRYDYKPKASTEQEFMTVKGGKVVITNKKGETIRTTITRSEYTQSRGLMKDYIAGVVKTNKDNTNLMKITTKINKGTATNRDYVDLMNLKFEYGKDPKTTNQEFKQAVKVGEYNKGLLTTQSSTPTFSPQALYLQNNPDIKIADRARIQRFRNDKGQIVGLSGDSLQQSIASPAGSFFKEEDITRAEKLSSATILLNEQPKKEKPKSPSQKLFDTAGVFIDKNLSKVGINATEERAEASKGWRIIKSTLKEDYDNVKGFVQKNFEGLKPQPRGYSVGGEIEGVIANNILATTEIDLAKLSSKDDLLAGNYKFKDIVKQKPFYESLQEGRQKTLEAGTVQANKMVESLLTTQEPLKVAGFTILNEQQATSINRVGNVAGELGLGIADMTMLIGSQVTKKPIIATGVIAAGVLAYSVAPTATAGLLTGVNVYDWVSRPTAEEKILAVSGDLALTGLAWGAPKVIEKTLTKLSPDYAKVEVDALGKKTIKGVDVAEDGRAVDIDLVPEGRKGLKDATINPRLLLEEYGNAIPFSKSPNIPKTTKFQEEFLSILKEDEILKATDTSVGGSFAQKALLKKSRPFGDLDIVTDDPLLIAMKTKEKFGDMVAIKKVTITDSPLGNFDLYKVAQRQSDGSLVHIADIDPLKFAEEGLASKYGSTMVEGLPVTDIRSRFIAKVKQASRGKRTDKVLEDIKILSDGKLSVDGQAFRGGFGWSFKEQMIFADTTGDVITSQRGLFPKKIFNKFKDDIVVKNPNIDDASDLSAQLFASPPDIVTGNPQLRASRLGLWAENKASFEDIFSGNAQVGKGQPQAVLFPNAKIGAIPDELKSLANKAKAGDKVAEAEFLKRYRKYQLTPTGEFKPFGFAGGEAEVTLAVGEVASGEGRIASTLIKGQKVSIIKAKVKSASPELTELQTKYLDSGLTTKETSKFNDLMKEESGSLSTRPVKPIIAEEEIFASSSLNREIRNPKANLIVQGTESQQVNSPQQQLSIASSPYSNISSMKSSPVEISQPISSSVVEINYPSSNIANSPTTQISYGSRGIISSPITVASSPDYSPSSIPSSPIEPIRELTQAQRASPPFAKVRTGKKRNGQGFDVLIRERGKWVKANTTPIRSLSEAQSFGRFTIGRTPQASFQTEKSKSRVKPVSFSTKTDPRKFYRKGTVFIEKNKYRINTQGELSGITFKGLQAQSLKSNFNKRKSKGVWGIKK